LQRYGQALVYYQAANDLKETPEANRMIGALLLNRNDLNGAIPYLQKATQADPKDEVSLYNLAGAYALAGRRDLALETVTRLLILDPDHEAARRLAASLESQ
jgi:tetratricopeptide (TPR) repeat protein